MQRFQWKNDPKPLYGKRKQLSNQKHQAATMRPRPAAPASTCSERSVLAA